MKLYEVAYDWSSIPTDLPRENLVLITAKTTNPTIHFNDPKYKIRKFTPTELKEAARSLAKRPVGLNHTLQPIPNAFTVDSQWNESTQAVEALLFLPTPYINLIKEREATNPIKFSIEYTWRNEKREGDEVEFEGLIFDRVDLLDGLSAGDKNTSYKLIESDSRRGLMEAEVVPPERDIKQDQIQQSVDDNSLSFFKELEEMEFYKKLGEPLSSDFQKIYDSMIAKYGPEKGKQVFYAWINKMGYDETKPMPKGKEAIEPPRETEDYVRVQQEPTDKFDKDSFRTINIDEDKGIKAVIGCPSGQYEGGKCKVGTQVQTFLFNKDKWDVDKAKDWTSKHKEETDRQVPEQPVNTLTTEEPSKLPVTTTISDSQKHSNVTSVGALADDKGPITPEPAITNPDKNLNQEPAKQDLPVMDSKKEGNSLDKGVVVTGSEEVKDKMLPDESKQSVEGDKLVESVEPKKEEKKNDKVSTSKVEPPKEDVKPIEPAPTEPNKPSEPVITKEPTLEEKVTKLEKENKDLNEAIGKLQENIKITDSEKDKAVKEAVKEHTKQVINDIEEVLPPANIISNFNYGGQRLAVDIRKKVFKLKESLREM